MGKWIGIVGESFPNDDGTSRQDEISRCTIGEPAILRYDPNNRHDPNCVKVLSARGVQIGNLSKEHAAIFASHMRAGNSIDAEIVKINGGTKAKPSRGVVIEADVDEDDFEQALEHVREHGLAGQRFHDHDSAPEVRSNALWLWGAAAAGVLLLAMCSS